MTARRRIEIAGVVQGVGFRPFVHRLATDVGLSGFVGNDGEGVFIELEGESREIDVVVGAISANPPPLARIDSVSVTDLPPTGDARFVIVPSRLGAGIATFVSPDLDACDDCVREMLDPADRRYRYPFVNCTNCGPRFTITLSTPYDRPATTMASFEMCDECRAEYDDPRNRRFHAQPNACPDCGPRLALEGADRAPIGGDPIEAARALVASGETVAVKGIGGFHLACDATNDGAVRRLRERKHREGKPFAVMVRDLETARRLARLSPAEEEALASRRRPIVLADSLPDSPVSASVAPGMARVGLMLPSSPLHRLLLEPGDAWVMTSGNVSSEPIVTDNDEARRLLSPIADALLFHDRDIHIPCDDSVIRLVGESELPIRRSRGYAPLPVKLGFETAPALAVGGELKATFCLASGRDAFMSQHIGDMENLETLDAFERAVAHMQGLFRVLPEILVADLHPRYLSASWAERVAGDRTVIRVQHHEAHIASVLAESRRSGPVIGFSFDGTGYGHDGTVWGGEILVGGLDGFERIGHLASVPLAGGDASVRRTYRMALSHLRAAGVPWDAGVPSVDACPEPERRTLARQLETGFGCVATTSAGRLFDAAASLAGVCQEATYEGQAAMEFEAILDPASSGAYPFGLSETFVIDPGPAIAALVGDRVEGVAPGAISARFHRGLAAVVGEAATRLSKKTGIGTIALSGGVFQNVSLIGEVSLICAERGLEVLLHRVVPPNDGGLALGQIALAAHRME